MNATQPRIFRLWPVRNSLRKPHTICKTIFDSFVGSSIQPKEGICFDGHVFDAYAFVAGLIRKDNSRIAVIDSCVDDSVLVQLSKWNPGVTLRPCNKAHDRFLIIDEVVYHIGLSLKDLGKKLFAFSNMDVMTGWSYCPDSEPCNVPLPQEARLLTRGRSKAILRWFFCNFAAEK